MWPIPISSSASPPARVLRNRTCRQEQPVTEMVDFCRSALGSGCRIPDIQFRAAAARKQRAFQRGRRAKRIFASAHPTRSPAFKVELGVAMRLPCGSMRFGVPLDPSRYKQ